MHERNILYIPLGAGILHFQILQIHFLAFFSGKQKIQKVQHLYLRCRKSLKGDSKFLLLFYGSYVSFSSYERNKSKKIQLGHFSRYCWTACYTLCFFTDLLIMLWYPPQRSILFARRAFDTSSERCWDFKGARARAEAGCQWWTQDHIIIMSLFSHDHI